MVDILFVEERGKWKGDVGWRSTKRAAVFGRVTKRHFFPSRHSASPPFSNPTLPMALPPDPTAFWIPTAADKPVRTLRVPTGL